MQVPRHIQDHLKEKYPNLFLRWNKQLGGFELWENFYHESVRQERCIWQYSNADGSRFPVVWDHLQEWLYLADTRRWPMHERIEQMRRDTKKDVEENYKDIRNMVEGIAEENFHYAANHFSVFVDPKSCPEWKKKYKPSQEKILRKWGVM